MMHGFNKYLFHKYTYVANSIYSAIISGTIFASSSLQAEVPTEITTDTLQREKSVNPVLPPQAKQAPKISTYTLQREKSVNPPPSSPPAEQAPEIEIIEQGGIYHIKVVAVIYAPARYVRHVLTDYKHIHRLNPSIIESEVLKQHDDGSVSVKTKVIGCAAYFCEELERVERVRLLPSGDLHAEIIPELSQFKSGQTFWRIKSLGDNTEVSYIADMEPDIFIPPVVGKFLVKKSIREAVKISFANLEKISKILAEREWQEK